MHLKPACALALALACSSGDAESPTRARERSSLPTAYVVNHPLQVFAQRIGGDSWDVRFPAPAEMDPADWSPTAEIVAAYQGADIILLNGAGYASWVARASLPAGTQIDTTAAVRDRLIPIEQIVTHQHGPTGEHSHGETAYTTWLDPTLALEQARAIADAFANARPEQKDQIRQRLAALESDLKQLDQRLERATANLRGSPLIFSHPVYQYFERRYRLDGRSLHWEPDELPSPRAWRDLEELRRNHPAEILIWESEPLPETARRLEAMGLRSVVVDPAGNARSQGDWFEIMNENADRLAAVATK
jgi:zinc transport system substrate-binding protein